MTSYVQQQQQLILRLPDDLALRMHELIKKRKAVNREVKTGVGGGVTSLSSKIDDTVTTAAAEAGTAGTGKNDDDNESIEATVRPADESNPSNDFIWCMDGKEYPALLMNLPTVVESHKTFDNKTFLKSGDIGQMLQVFRTNEEKEVVRNKIHKHALYGEYMPSGLTPPTIDIVKRKFELTRKNDHSAFLPYRIRQVHDDINNFGMQTSSSGNQGRNSIVAQNHASVLTSLKESYARYLLLSRPDRKDVEAAVVSESVLEEVVDFEEWMIDPTTNSRDIGITTTVHDGDWFTAEAAMLLQHPELLVTDEEREEESFDALAAEEKRAAQAKQAADAAIIVGDNSRISSSAAAAAEEKGSGDGDGNDDAVSSEKSILRLSRSFSASMQTKATLDEDMIADEVEDEGVLNESTNDDGDGGEEEEEEEEGRDDNRSVGSEDSDTAWMRNN